MVKMLKKEITVKQLFYGSTLAIVTRKLNRKHKEMKDEKKNMRTKIQQTIVRMKPNTKIVYR